MGGALRWCGLRVEGKSNPVVGNAFECRRLGEGSVCTSASATFGWPDHQRRLELERVFRMYAQTAIDSRYTNEQEGSVCS